MSEEYQAGYSQGCDDYFKGLTAMPQPTWTDAYIEGYRLAYIEANVYWDMMDA